MLGPSFRIVCRASSHAVASGIDMGKRDQEQLRRRRTVAKAWYQVWCSAMSGPYAEEKWRDSFKQTHPCCSGCARHLSEWGSVDAYVEEFPKNSCHNFVSPFLVDYVRRDVLACFTEEERHRGLHVGRLFDAGGAELTDFATIRGKHAITLRGGPESEHRLCRVCGEHVYFPIGATYLLPHSVASGEPIYEAHVGFVVNRAIYERLSQHRWKHLKLAPLPIRDKPRDGLDDLLL